MNLPIAVLGEALMDCVLQDDGRLLPLMGGSPFNLARAAARQGARVHCLAPFSQDRFGQDLKSCARADAIGWPAADSPWPTCLAVVAFDGAQARYAFYREGVADRDWTPKQVTGQLRQLGCGILHTGSPALMPPDGRRVIELMETARSMGWILSVDINVRTGLASDPNDYRGLVLEAASLADWVKASDEDLQALALLPSDPEIPIGPQALAQVRQDLAPAAQRLALTQGAAGAWLWMDGQAWQAPAPRVELVDTVGAGDTFWGACLADWSLGLDEGARNLDRAIHAAAIVCARTGCQPPTRVETDAAAQAAATARPSAEHDLQRIAAHANPSARQASQ